MPSHILENAIVRLLKKRPFYGQFILNLHRKRARGIHPIGVTISEGSPTLAINEELFAILSAQSQEGLLEHCVKHLLHLHISRRKGRNQCCWDVSCDLAINPAIEGMPPEAPMPADYKEVEGLAAEEYYARLVPTFDIGNLSGEGIGKADQDRGGESGPGSGEQQQRFGGPVDDHASWQDAESMPLRLAEEVIRGIIRDARRQSDGQVPDDIRELVEGLLKPTVIPWRQVLRQFAATAGRVGSRSTWQREHRRFQHNTPGRRKLHRLNLLVGIDVSDSTNIVELREAFARELMQIARGRDTQITALYANSRIQRVESLRGERVKAESCHGGGFTDLRPVFEYARGMRPLPAGIIYLTDGFGDAPELMEFPTLWVLTSEGEKPVEWGVELRLEV